MEGFESGLRTRIWPSDNLATQLKLIDFPASRPRHPSAEVIELRGPKSSKGTKGELLDYYETADTRRMRHNLVRYNEWLSRQWIDLRVTESDLRDINLQLGKDPDRQLFDASRINLKRVF